MKNSGLEKIPVAFYQKNDREITKFLIREGNVDAFKEFGFSGPTIDSLSKQLSFVNHWAYLTIDLHLKEGISADKIRQIYDLEKQAEIQKRIKEMKGNDEWMDALKKKAQASNRPFEDVLYNDAKWIIEQEH